jgi:hypothetical protein
MADSSLITCACGVVLVSADELVEFALCFDCAAVEPEQACDCPGCVAARELLFVA